jgi:ribosomal protein S18 acetylase RimI-like enzyme
VIIRAMQATDRSAWDELFTAYAQFYDVPQSPEMRAKVWVWLSDPANEVNGLVADNNGTLIGFAHYRSFARPLAAESGSSLDDLFVAEAARGSGAANALIDAIKVRAVEQGHSIVRWITAADNGQARGLYDKVAQVTQWVTYDLTV